MTFKNFALNQSTLTRHSYKILVKRLICFDKEQSFDCKREQIKRPLTSHVIPLYINSHQDATDLFP